MELIDSLICMANKAQNPKTKIIVNHSLLMALIFSLRRASLQGVSILGRGGVPPPNRLGVTSVLYAHVLPSRQRQSCSGGGIN